MLNVTYKRKAQDIRMMKIIKLAILVCHTFTLSHGFGIWGMKSSATLTNDLGAGLAIAVQCYVRREESLGLFYLPDGEKRVWEFRYLWDWVDMHCQIGRDTPMYITGANLFNAVLKYGYNPKWSIRRDGVYVWQGKILSLFGRGKWEKMYEWY